MMTPNVTNCLSGSGTDCFSGNCFSTPALSVYIVDASVCIQPSLATQSSHSGLAPHPFKIKRTFIIILVGAVFELAFYYSTLDTITSKHMLTRCMNSTVKSTWQRAVYVLLPTRVASAEHDNIAFLNCTVMQPSDPQSDIGKTGQDNISSLPGKSNMQEKHLAEMPVHW